MVQVTNFWDVLCNYCIILMRHMCDLTGISYGCLNIWLFVILGPLSTILGVAAAFCYRTGLPNFRKAGDVLLIAIGLIVLLICTLVFVSALTML